MRLKLVSPLPLIICLAVFMVYATTSLKQYYAHQTSGDLTAYAQGMWNTLHNNFMASTYNYSVHNYYDQTYRFISPQESNIFGIHFNPILLLLLPAFALFPHPTTLLVVQSGFIAFSGYLIYLLANKLLSSKLLSFALTASFLLHLSVISAALSQFHAYSLAIFFGLLLVYLTQSRPLLFYSSLALFLMVQENTPLIAAFYGLYLLLFLPKWQWRGVCTFAVSLLYFILVINWAIPALSYYNSYLFGSIYGSRLGNSLGEIFFTSLTNPLLLFQVLLTPLNLRYLFDLLFSTLPFSLFSPATLAVALLALAQNLLSSEGSLKTHALHYESGAVPFLYLSLILGIRFLTTRLSSIPPRLFQLVLTLLILVLALVGYRQHVYTRLNPRLLFTNYYQAANSAADELITLIPSGASVSTQNYLSAHLFDRPVLYQFPVLADEVDYLLLAKNAPTWPLEHDKQQEYLSQFRSSQSHRVEAENQYFVLFRRVN